MAKGNSGTRKQTVTPRSRRLNRGRRGGGKSLELGGIIAVAFRFWKPGLVVISLVAVVIGFSKLTASQVFALHRIEVKGASSELQPEIERTVRQAVGSKRLLDLSLGDVRNKLEAIPRVRTAWVIRSLPDVIRVEVLERQPAVLVLRQSGNLVWLDSDGTELGDTSVIQTPGTGGLPPLAKGFSEGNRTQAAVAEDKERVALYKKLQDQFSQGPDAIWERLDQIDFTYVPDVSIRLASPSVSIRLGSQNYENRAENALQVLNAIQKRNLNLLGQFGLKNVQQFVDNPELLASVDTSRGDRIVLIPVHAAVKTSDVQEPKPSRAPGKSK
jgi:hypothetical protein